MPANIRDYNSPLVAQKTFKYDVYFYCDTISTTVTVDPTAVTQWISDIKLAHGSQRGPLIVGLDTEWSLTPTAASRNPVATVQLCVGRRCLIHQIRHSPIKVPQSLADFLSDDNALFVGVGVKEDLRKLWEEYEIGGDAAFVDLRREAAAVYQRRELNNWGLKRLASLVLEKEMEKPKEVTMSKWDNRWLGAEQVRYACLDAFVSFEIGRVLIDRTYDFSDTSS